MDCFILLVVLALVVVIGDAVMDKDFKDSVENVEE